MKTRRFRQQGLSKSGLEQGFGLGVPTGKHHGVEVGRTIVALAAEAGQAQYVRAGRELKRQRLGVCALEEKNASLAPLIPARQRALAVAERGAEAPPARASVAADSGLDVHDYLVRRDEASFVFELRDDAMSGVGLFEGDLLVIDQRIAPAHGHLVLAHVGGECLVRRLHNRGRRTALEAEHPDYAELPFAHGSELTIWGVVVGSFWRHAAQPFGSSGA